jgi:hypothetical protein
VDWGEINAKTSWRGNVHGKVSYRTQGRLQIIDGRYLVIAGPHPTIEELLWAEVVNVSPTMHSPRLILLACHCWLLLELGVNLGTDLALLFTHRKPALVRNLPKISSILLPLKMHCACLQASRGTVCMLVDPNHTDTVIDDGI